MGKMIKTPEEIKKDLAAWGTGVRIDIGCGEFVPPTPEYMLNGVRSADVFRDALAQIQQLEAQVPKWISVEDRLPEEPGEVLMVLYGRVCIAWYHIDGRFESGSGLVFSAGEAVTHWMPLPEPPKEE